MSVVDSEVALLLYRIRAVLSIEPAAGSCSVLVGLCHFFSWGLRAFAGPESQFGFLDLGRRVDPLFPFEVVGGLISCDEAKDPFLLE